MQEDGKGRTWEREQRLERGIIRFLVMRQGFIKKIPVWNEWLGIHIYHS